jgi:lipopolysaccharide export LptBFGC system permease protein LptF
MMTFTRHEFLKKLIRAMLVAFLAFLAFSLGSKAVSGKECTTCPGKGICNGETDCSNYLIGKDEGR